MATDLQGPSLTFTATNVLVRFPVTRLLIGLTFQGKTLTAGQLLTMRSGSAIGAGPLVSDCLTEPNSDGIWNAELWAGKPPLPVDFLSLDNTTVAGTWRVTAFFA